MVGPADQSKLSISNKIVGREEEIEELQDIYRQVRDNYTPSQKSRAQRRNAKAVFVKGLSGTGKSRLVLEALQSIVESDGGYFCHGKFDLNRSLRPFAALADALNDLCSKASKDIDGDDEVQRRLERVADKESTRAVVSIVPNIALCLPKMQPKTFHDSSAPSNFSSANGSFHSSGSSTFGASQQQVSAALSVQFKITLRNFVKAFLTRDKILVMFIDDLQWADVDSLDLIDDLINHLPFHRFLFVGGFRSDEVKEGQYLFDFLEEALLASVPASIVSIQQLTLEHISTFVADTLKLNDSGRVAPLASLVHEKTQGNIFFVRQYLDFLYQNGHVFYSQQNFRWEWANLATIQDATAEESSIGAVVSKRILKLPRDTVDALKLAACIGGRFDLDVIEYVAKQWWKATSDMDPSSVDAIKMDDVLWNAVEEGLLEEVYSDPMSLTATLQYKFTHDKVQTASYILIGEATAHHHLLVGRYLLQLYHVSEDRKLLLVMAADHVYKSESIVIPQKDRDEYAEVNLLAAVELESNAAFKSAAVYCQNAIDFLGENCFDNNYDLSLKVYNMSATMEFCSGSKVASDKRIDKILQHGRCLEDKYTAYYIRIKSCHHINEFKEGAAIAYALLRQMKVTRLPRNISTVNLVYEMISAFRALKRLSTEELLNQPTTEDHTIAQYAMFLMQCVLCCFSYEPKNMCYLVFRAVNVSLRFGYSTFTPSFFALCSFLKVATTRDFQEADRISRISMELSLRFTAPQADVITKFICYSVAWTRHPMAEVPALMKEVHGIGFGCGDCGWGSIAGGSDLALSFLFASVSLDKLASLAAFYRDEMRLYDNVTCYDNVRATRQAALNLLGRDKFPARLEGDEIKNWAAFEAAIQNPRCRNYITITLQLILAQYFHDLHKAERLASESLKLWKEVYPFASGAAMRVYHCLIWSSLYKRRKQAKLKRRFREAYKDVLGWCKAGSPNAATFCLLIEAVKKSTFDRCSHDEVRVAYEEAVVKTTESGLRSFSAITAEQAGMHFASIQGQEDVARSFLEMAIQRYQDWRAIAKVRDVYERNSRLLKHQPATASNDTAIAEASESFLH